MERGFARPGADLGADSGADFIFEMRVFLGGLISGSRDHAAAISQVFLTSLREAFPLVVGQQAKHVEVILESPLTIYLLTSLDRRA